MAKAKVPGGAYLNPDGKTWHDAEGRPIDAPAGAKARGDAQGDSISIAEIYEMCEKAGLKPDDLELVGENPTRKEVGEAIGRAKAAQKQQKPNK